MRAKTPVPQLEELSGVPVAELRTRWRTHFGDDPPAFRSRDLLERAFVYRLECARHGDIKPLVRRRLAEIASKFAADPAFDPAPRTVPTVGSALVRDWNGVRHVVLVTAEGFQYLDRTYPSLTPIAKVISGTHQSGPKFFGLLNGKLKREACGEREPS